jgi:hypothetical protein
MVFVLIGARLGGIFSRWSGCPRPPQIAGFTAWTEGELWRRLHQQTFGRAGPDKARSTV